MAQKTERAAKKQNLNRSELFRIALEEFLYALDQQEARREWEIKDSQEAIKIFEKQRKQGKLKTLKSLADLA